jgi:hypothetical protein
LDKVKTGMDGMEFFSNISCCWVKQAQPSFHRLHNLYLDKNLKPRPDYFPAAPEIISG